MQTLTAATLSETHESKVLFNQALEMLSRSHIRGAIKHLEEALQISPNNAAYLSHYGLCVAIDREDFDAAVKLCERALKIDPKDVVSRVNLGKVYRMQGDNSAAYDEFLRAWKADKSHPGPASELSRMGIRRPPIVPFLSRSHWLNVRLGRLRARLNRGMMGQL
jgi:tetratricopeptide (TPR) repeat protein